jgi:hypothetical protein
VQAEILVQNKKPVCGRLPTPGFPKDDKVRNL